MKFVRIASLVVFLVACGVAACLSVVLFLVAETVLGRVYATASMGLVSAAIVGCIAFLPKLGRCRRALFHVAVALAGSGVVLWFICVSMAPDAGTGEGFRSEWFGSASPSKISPANIVPEIDQLNVLLGFLPFSEASIDRREAGRLRGVFGGLYQAMQGDGAFSVGESALRDAYRSTIGFPLPAGHLYSYVPDNPGGGKLPVVVFLHGEYGNLRATLWVWKRFADKHGYAIVAPTCGRGDWEGLKGLRAVQTAIDYCGEHPGLDVTRLTLAGHGRGCSGIPRVTGQFPEVFRELLFVSPVFDAQAMEGEGFRQQYQGKPVYVVHGDEDGSYALDKVREDCAGLQKAGVDVTLVTFSREGHHLLWTREKDVRGVFDEWYTGDSV